jgi:hypothetical protein
MIGENKRAKSVLREVIEGHGSRFLEQAEELRGYQDEVRRRIREKRRGTERRQELEIELIASMLPTAMDMHKFTRIMTKDKAFEHESGYKIVTAIRTFKDKERLKFLLNNNLSTK